MIDLFTSACNSDKLGFTRSLETKSLVQSEEILAYDSTV